MFFWSECSSKHYSTLDNYLQILYFNKQYLSLQFNILLYIVNMWAFPVCTFCSGPSMIILLLPSGLHFLLRNYLWSCRGLLDRDKPLPCCCLEGFLCFSRFHDNVSLWVRPRMEFIGMPVWVDCPIFNSFGNVWPLLCEIFLPVLSCHWWHCDTYYFQCRFPPRTSRLIFFWFLYLEKLINIF